MPPTHPRCSWRLDTTADRILAFWSGTQPGDVPIVKGVEKEYCRRVNFVYLDIDDPATKIFKLVLRFGWNRISSGRRAWKSAPAMGGVCDRGAIPAGAGCSFALMPPMR